MTRLFFAAATFFLVLHTHAQEVVTKAKVSYVTLKNMNYVSLNKKKEMLSTSTFSFDGNVLKVTKEMFTNKQITSIQKLGEETATRYISQDEKLLKYVDQLDALIEFGDYDKTSFKYTYLADTQTIKGILCYKAIIDCMGDNSPQKIEVWYTKEKKLKLDGFNYILSGLEGMAVKVLYREFPKIKIVSSADLIINCELTLEHFEENLSEDVAYIKDEDKYEMLDKNQMMQVLLNMAGLNRKAGTKAPQGEAIETIKKNADGTELKLTKYNPFKLNQPLAPFKGTTLQGKEISMANYENKVLVLNFWFTQCMPCIKEMPLLNKVKEQYANNSSIEFISINHQTAAEVSEFFKTTPYTFTAIVDAQHLIDLYGVFTYPATIVVDKKGLIKFIQIGEFKTIDDLSKEIDKLM